MNNKWIENIDIYCERLAPGLFAEPLNAITNFSFFIAAFFLFRLAKSKKYFDHRSFILIGLIVIIGAGSTFFHTLATYWAMLSDQIPILLFQIAFLIFYARGVMRLSRLGTCLMLAAFFASIYIFGSLPREWLNGSLAYAPAFLILGGLGFWHWFYAQRERGALLLAMAVFAVSLTFRSLDMTLCPALPAGLHFLWHILNGTVLYLTVRAYLLNANR